MRRILFAAALFAAAASATALDLSAYGFAKTGEKSIGKTTFSVLADTAGGTILLDAEADPTPDRAQALRTLVTEVRSWKDIKASAIQAVNTADLLTLTVIPASFDVEGVSLAGAVPGGIQLFFDTSAEYGFKVLTGNYLVRVDGPYTSEAQLESTALSAFKDPISFVAARDPASLQNMLKGDIAAMKADILALKAENERLKAAAIAALNGGKPVKPDVEAKIAELMKAKPDLDKPGVVAGLKTAGIKATSGEINAILIVDYGRY